MSVLRVLLVCAGFVVMSQVAFAATCAAPPNASVVATQGHPFGIAVSQDGCWMFVATVQNDGGGTLDVLRDANGEFEITRTIKLHGPGFGEALTPNGALLAVTEGARIEVFDVAGLKQQSADALAGTLTAGHAAGAVYAIASPDGRLLFVSDEQQHRLGVYDLRKWRTDHFKGDPVIGDVPTAAGPVGLAFSPDGKWLYATSEAAFANMGLQKDCSAETLRGGRVHTPGVVIRVDVAKAASAPGRSVAGVVRAGCNPVRIAVSSDGVWLWVTARGSNAVLRIPTARFQSGATAAAASSFRVGQSPVGIAIRPDGNQVWVALSDRFASSAGAGNGRQLVGLVGTGGATLTSVRMMAELVSGFPRELAFLPDGRTLVVGLYAAGRIEFFATPP